LDKAWRFKREHNKNIWMRNFVVNYQWGYAGTSYEIFYQTESGLIEIASTNKYKFKVKEITTKGKVLYNLSPAKKLCLRNRIRH